MSTGESSTPSPSTSPAAKARPDKQTDPSAALIIQEHQVLKRDAVGALGLWLCMTMSS
jgi:hypothetical protein